MNRTAVPAICSFLIALSLIAFEVLLHRSLAVSSYQFFGYFVITMAMLGFGLSGVLLRLLDRRIGRQPEAWLAFWCGATTVSMVACYGAALKIPLDSEYLLYDPTGLAGLLLYILCLTAPFLFGAAALGTVLRYGTRKGLLYGANLAGSGIGGVVALLIATTVPAVFSPFRCAGAAALAAAVVLAAPTGRTYRRPAAAMILRSLLIAVVLGIASLGYLVGGDGPVTLDPWIEPYKEIMHFRRLAAQGEAELIAEDSSPEGEIAVYSAPSFHRVFFAGLGAKTPPPRQAAVLIDGRVAGVLLDPAGRSAEEFARSDDLAIFDHTPQSLPYRVRDPVNVLILGDTGGQAAWAALRMGVGSVTLVTGDVAAAELLRAEASVYTDSLYADPRVRVVTVEPHVFVAADENRYDLIQLAAAEGMPSGGRGLSGLMEDRLLTVESIGRCIDLLSEDGILFAVRGLQVPPRDTPKLIGLFSRALASTRMDEYGILVGHNYLAALVAVFRGVPEGPEAAAIDDLSRELGIELDYRFGTRLGGDRSGRGDVEAGETSTVDPGSYFMADPGVILGQAAASGLGEYVYDIRPPTLNRPFFHNFFEWGSIDLFRSIYGRDWFRRLELGYFLVVVTLLLVTAIGLVGIVLPALFIGRRSRGAGNQGKGSAGAVAEPPSTRVQESAQSSARGGGIVYFLAIGAGFMTAEIAAVGRAAAILPSPAYALAAVLTGFLLAAGAGSAVAPSIRKDPRQRVLTAVVGIGVSLLVSWFGTGRLYAMAAELAVGLRFLVVFAWLLPRAFFMGWLMPAGLDIYGRRAGSSARISLLWAVNGFASVIAVPAAALVSISLGFRAAGAGALLLYGAALVTASRSTHASTVPKRADRHAE